MPVEVYRRVVSVEAIQFWGWQNADDIWKWAKIVFYVPPGAEHRFRRKPEMDGSSGMVHEEAPEFLVIKTVNAEARVDVGDWVIKGLEGDFYTMKNEPFQNQYTASK